MEANENNNKMVSLPTMHSTPTQQHHILPPKHEPWNLPPQSPKITAARQGLIPTPLENLTSEANSMDISDITMEIDKLSKENPEVAIKDSNRLLKEIDHQMEMSFEIMEERSNMVREYLKEREKSEKKYKTKADQMMEEFNNKMNMLENSLTLNESTDVGTSTIKSSYTQTFLQVFKEAAVQTSERKTTDETIETPPSFEEVVAALTQDIQKTVASQYAKERKALVCELAAKKNKMDRSAIEDAIHDLNTELKKDEEYLREISKSFVNDYMEETKSQLTENDKEKLIRYLQEENELSEPSFDGYVMNRKALKEYKSRYQQAVHGHIQNSIKAAEDKLTKAIKELRTCCLVIDRLQNRYNRLLKELSKSGLSEQEIEGKLLEIKSVNTTNEKQLLVYKLVCETQARDLIHSNTRRHIEDALSHLNDIQTKEDELKNKVLPELASTQESYWKQQLAHAHKNAEKVIKEKEDLLKQLHNENTRSSEGCGESFLTLRPKLDMYIDPVEIHYEQQEKMEEYLSVEPKMGKQLMEDLVHGDKKSDIKAIDVIKYQEKSMETILKDYEKDIEELNESFNVNSAYKEVMELIGGKDITNDLIGQLNAEKEKVENKIIDCDADYKHVNENLLTLKLQKDKILTKDGNLKNQKSFLHKTLSQINKDIADQLVQNKREKESFNREKRLKDVAAQVGQLQDTLPKTDEKQGNQDNSIASIRQRLGHLRKNLEKLLPFVNENTRKKIQRDSKTKVPNSETIEKVLETKSNFSNQLLNTEKKIQEIITSDGYDSSIGSGTMENIEEMQRDPSASPNALKRTSPNSPQNVNMDLNSQLLNVEMELENIDRRIKERGVESNDYAQVDDICQRLSASIRVMESSISLSPKNPSKRDDVNAINKEIEKLKKELHDKGESNMIYNKQEEEEILRDKETAVENLKQMREDAKFSKKESAISNALKDLLQERDRTTSIIIALNEDIETLDELKRAMAVDGEVNLNDKMANTNKLLLEKKADNVTKMVAIARNKLGYFINLVKIKMKERLDEASKTNWTNKNRLTKEEKQELGKELRDVLAYIKLTETDLQQIIEYQQTGHVTLRETETSSSFNELFQRKNSLAFQIEEVDRKIQSFSKSAKNKSIVNKLTAERIEKMEELEKLNELIDKEGMRINEKMQKLKEIKKGLETKLADSVDVNDLKQIISELDKKESSQFNYDGIHDEGSLSSLMKERKNLTENILQVIYSSPNENGKIQRMNDVLEGIDVDILTQIDESLTNLNAVPDIEGDRKMEAFELLSTTANAFKFLKDKAELERALRMVDSQHERTVNLDSVREQRNEISTLEQLKSTLVTLQNRGIDINSLNEIKTCKSLNEEKLDRLLTKIKNLNQLVDTRKKLDRRAKSIEELTVGDLQQMSLTTDMINNELQSIVKCYESDLADNITRTNLYLRLPMNPKLTSDSLSLLLEKRDEKLNQLFLIEKEIEEEGSSVSNKKQQLSDVKDVLAKEIDLIDESIVNCQYMATAKHDSPIAEHGSPSRSFSPRSTSSRTSFTVYMEERDHILRELFQIEKGKEKFTEGDLHHAKHSSIEVILNQKDQLTTQLKQLTKRMLGDRDHDVSLNAQQKNKNYEAIAYPHILNKSSINKALKDLKIELQNDKIFLHRGEQQNQPEEADEISTPFTNPPELECLEDIRRFEKKLNLESMKKALQSLEEEKRIIEENMAAGSRRSQNKGFATTRRALEDAKKELNQNKEKLDLLKKRRELEDSLKGLKQNIHNNHKLSEKMEAENHKEFVKHENDISLREHKRNKVKLERDLDEINNTLYQYVYSLETEIDDIVKEQKEIDKRETLTALKEHQIDLEERVISTNKYLAGRSDVPLPKLLSTRRRTCNELNKLNETIDKINTVKEKEKVTNSIRDVQEQEKHLSNMQKKLQYKNELLNQKLNEISTITNTSKRTSVDKIKEALGNDLYNLIQNPKGNSENFPELKQCLEDRTLEVYIKDLQNLNKVQSEQVNHLKEDLNKALDSQRDALVAEKATELTSGTQITQLQGNGGTPSNLEDMIQKLQDELVVAEEMRNKFKSKLGEKLYNILNDEQSLRNNSVAINFETKLNRYLENLKTILNKNEATLEQLLEQNFNNIEGLSQENEASATLTDKLQEEKIQLAKHLHDRDEQIELLRKQDEHFSETESFKDNLQRQGSISIEEENAKLKEDFQKMAEQIQVLSEQNKKLKQENDTVATRESSLLTELETMKNLRDSAEKVNRLSDTEKNQQTELENIRKKLKKMAREKITIQENLEKELKNIDSLRDDLNNFQQKDKQAVHGMHKHCQTIEKQDKEVKRLKDVITQLETLNGELQTNLNEIKEKYQTLSTKYQGDSIRTNKELRIAKIKINAQELEIERLVREQEDGVLKERLQQSVIEHEKSSKENNAKEYKQNLEETTSKNQSMNATIVELQNKVRQLDKQNHDLTNENQVLLTKLKDLDESFENEVSETRRELSDKFGKTVDKMNEKLRKLANDLVRLEKEKQEIIEQNQILKEQNTDQINDINEQKMILDSQGKTQSLKLLSINTELESFKLENDELREQILALKKQLKQKDLEGSLNKDLDEKRDRLNNDLQRFEEDKERFEESLQGLVRKQQGSDSKSKTEDKVSVKLLKATQEERDELSDELIKSNRELHTAKNELRKLKMNLREKEQDYTEDEKRIIQKIEEDCKRKLDEQIKNHKKEKDQILMMYNEDRNKWEEELEKLKQDLQEDTLKKLAEQRNDYEEELEKQIQLYVKQNEEELEEERDKNTRLESQRLTMIEQFEEEKVKITEKNDLQRQAMVEIIKRLLKHLMLLKKQRSRLRNSYEDEISELEERLESEKKLLVNQKQKELQTFKENLMATGMTSETDPQQINSLKNLTNAQRSPKKKLNTNSNIKARPEKEIDTRTRPDKENDTRTRPDKEIDARMRPERENDTSTTYGGDYKLSLTDLRDLISMGDLKDIIDSNYDEEKESLQKSMREQYEVKLRMETDYLMRRLLELSDELDALRANH